MAENCENLSFSLKNGWKCHFFNEINHKDAPVRFPAKRPSYSHVFDLIIFKLFTLDVWKCQPIVYCLSFLAASLFCAPAFFTRQAFLWIKSFSQKTHLKTPLSASDLSHAIFNKPESRILTEIASRDYFCNYTFSILKSLILLKLLSLRFQLFLMIIFERNTEIFYKIFNNFK